MWGKLRKVIAFGLIAVVAVYAGSCAYINWIQPKVSAPYTPDATKAPYVFTERATGQQVLTDKYTMQGHAYVLSTYWQMQKNGGWKLIKKELKLDPRYFGPIEIARRPPSAN
jgi:hypothetical protein